MKSNVNLVVVWSDAMTTTAQCSSVEAGLEMAEQWRTDRFYARGRRIARVFMGEEGDTAPAEWRVTYRLGQARFEAVL